MEGLNPSLKFALFLRQSLESGDSVRTAIRNYLSCNHDELSYLVSAWFMRKEQGQSVQPIFAQLKSPYRKSLLDCADRGLRGESILPQIILLEQEIMLACDEEIERFASLLPLKALVPLLLLQFPALFILFLAPLLTQLTQSL